MSQIDWIILAVTLLVTVCWGIYKSRGQTGSDSYILAGKNASWVSILIGIMATQASAVTFISGPGQSYNDGMRFLQYYFGLPIAMIVISAVFVPYFQKQKVHTAYEFLENRFDKKTRYISSILFLISRGISTGFSIVAPAVILNTIFSWDIYLSIFLIGGILISYTFLGGAQSILHTQKLQFTIIILSMLLAGFMLVFNLPEGVGFTDALYIAGKSDKLNVITTDVNFSDRYNLLSGIIGGFFLALSYFGTDQSQVGRYLSGKDVKESRLGLLYNGIVKIPMQFGILLIGALLFSFYILKGTPIFFNEQAVEKLEAHHSPRLDHILLTHDSIIRNNQHVALQLIKERHDNPGSEKIALLGKGIKDMENNKALFRQELIESKVSEQPEDVNYVFLYFVRHYLPTGVVGLVLAVIFLASWGSISPALNSLATTTYIDLHKSSSQRLRSDHSRDVWWSRAYTLVWGFICILMACLALEVGSSLIESVNILGSLFYGPMLGIFLVAFFIKRIRGTAVFWATIVAEGIVFIVFLNNWVSFLWLNVIGAVCLIIVGAVIQLFLNKNTTPRRPGTAE